MTDTDALQRYARRRDPEAFAHLVESYQQMVYAVCLRRLGHEADARDATQETFIKLARSAGDIRAADGGASGGAGGSVVGWLHRCAATTSIDLIRGNARRRGRERAVAVADQAEPVDPGDTAWGAARAVLDDALGELPDDQRELIVQRYLVGRPQTQLAVEAGVSESMMSRRVRGALQELRECLKAKGLGVGLMALGTGLATESAVALPAGLSAGLTSVGVTGVGAGAGAKTGLVGVAWGAVLPKVAAGVFAVAGVGTAGVVGYQQFAAPETRSAAVVAAAVPPPVAAPPAVASSAQPVASAGEQDGQGAFFVYVMGAIDRPGAYTIPRDKRVSFIELLEMTGGAETLPQDERLVLIRRVNDDEDVSIYDGTVAELRAAGRERIYLEPDDLIRIGGASRFNNTVNEPGE